MQNDTPIRDRGPLSKFLRTSATCNPPSTFRQSRFSRSFVVCRELEWVLWLVDVRPSSPFILSEVLLPSGLLPPVKSITPETTSEAPKNHKAGNLSPKTILPEMPCDVDSMVKV